MDNKDVLSPPSPSPPHPPQTPSQGDSGEIRMVLVGKTGTGKSATGNTLIGENVFKSKGSPKSVTTECTVVQKERFGKTLMAIDTPGFLDTNMSSEKLMEELVSCTCLAYPGIHALLIVFQVGHRYIEEDEIAIGSMKELFCQKFVNHTVVVFTGKDTLDADEQTLEDYISELPDSLRQLIASCKGGAVAISNRGNRDEREQAAKKIITTVEKLVRKNGGESQYYKTVLSVAISKMVAKKIEEILNRNVEVNEKIRLVEQEKERLSGDDPRIQQKREKLEGTIRDLEKKLIDEDTARKKAVEESLREWISRLKKIGVAAMGIASMVAFVVFKIIR